MWVLVLSVTLLEQGVQRGKNPTRQQLKFSNKRKLFVVTRCCLEPRGGHRYIWGALGNKRTSRDRRTAQAPEGIFKSVPPPLRSTAASPSNWRMLNSSRYHKKTKTVKQKSKSSQEEIKYVASLQIILADPDAWHSESKSICLPGATSHQFSWWRRGHHVKFTRLQRQCSKNRSSVGRKTV